MSALETELNTIARFLEQAIREQLVEDGKIASGELVKSIENVVSRGSNSFVIEGSMAEQGKFVISGRKVGAKGVPIDALVRWIEQKNFSTGVKSTRGLAFAIQKNIKEKGIEPNDFIETVFQRFEGQIDRDINNAIEQALDVELTNLITNAQRLA